MGTKVSDEHNATICRVEDDGIMFPEKNNMNRNCSENLIFVRIQTYREYIIYRNWRHKEFPHRCRETLNTTRLFA
jgi:hypothetical protein